MGMSERACMLLAKNYYSQAQSVNLGVHVGVHVHTWVCM